MKTFSILAALLFSAQWLSAQETQSPLPLFVSGFGKIVPFHDGEMLDNDRRYVMTAVPEKGYVFANWQPVDVFTFTEYTLDGAGQLEERTFTVTTPEDQYFKDRALHFTMQPEEVLFDVPNVREVTMSQGWQADFVPAPKEGHDK